MKIEPVIAEVRHFLIISVLTWMRLMYDWKAYRNIPEENE